MASGQSASATSKRLSVDSSMGNCHAAFELAFAEEGLWPWLSAARIPHPEDPSPSGTGSADPEVKEPATRDEL